jgi:2-oxo-3-hexenedioate decarboxylase
MDATELLQHSDLGQLWPAALSRDPRFTVPQAYQRALAVRTLREHRGEQPRGFKIGFTNRTIWPRYNVYAPIWGTVWDTSLSFCEGQGSLSLAHICQPRLEPEIVFGMKAVPAADATLDQLFNAIDWVAPGFEVVQSHLPGWTFEAADTVADSGLHARLLVGQCHPVLSVARDAAHFDALLAQAQVTLSLDGKAVDDGQGANVLDGPLRAMQHFVGELRRCPGAPDLRPGDVVTTGTWTDAWPLKPGERWQAAFTLPGFSLSVSSTA